MITAKIITAQSPITIVLPCYRVAAYVRDAVLSIMAQRYQAWTAIIVDDGSPDDIYTPIADLLHSEPRLKYIRKTNGGVASARNYGCRVSPAASGYIMFLDADDVLKQGALDRMADYLDSTPSVGLIHCEAEVIDEAGCVLDREFPVCRSSFCGREIPPTEPETPFESIYTLSFIIPSLCMMRRAVFDKTGGYDESFGHNMEDTDLHLRMALLAPVHFLPFKLVQYRLRFGQATADSKFLFEQAERLWKKWREAEQLPRELRDFVNAVEDFRCYTLTARSGFEAANRHFSEGKWALALRFWQGALRRLFMAQWRQRGHRYPPRHPNLTMMPFGALSPQRFQK